MEIMPLLALGIIWTVLVVILRPLRPELATLLAAAAGVMLLLLVLGKVRGAVAALAQMAERAELNPVFLRTTLKVVGLAYLAGFAGQICRDAGEGAMAGKIEFVGKVGILLLALPVVWAVLETLLKLF